MMSISWHLIVFLLVEIFLIYRMYREGNEGGDWFNINPFLYLVGIVLVLLIYGGIMWW